MTATHATFTIERDYDRTPADVFAAWADTARKAAWFPGPKAEHTLDFRVGGRELTSDVTPDGQAVTYDTTYHEIVDGERIVYTSALSFKGQVATVSLTTIEFAGVGEGTHLVLTEHGAFLDELELPVWREEGTATQLDTLGTYLAGES
jgi:uncharacterized protein YndB with AHSA1/START domain